MKRLLDETVATPASLSCPTHSSRRDRVQSSERRLYECTCFWDACTAAQLKAAG